MATEDEILESDLKKEHTHWEELQIDPSHWQPNGGMFGMYIRMDVMNEILRNAGLMPTEEELNTRTKELMLEKMREIREQAEPKIRAAKVAALRKNGNLIVPPGFKQP